MGLNGGKQANSIKIKNLGPNLVGFVVSISIQFFFVCVPVFFGQQKSVKLKKVKTKHKTYYSAPKEKE